MVLISRFLLLICLISVLSELRAESLQLSKEGAALEGQMSLWVDEKGAWTRHSTLPEGTSFRPLLSGQSVSMSPEDIGWAQFEIDAPQELREDYIFWIDGFFYPVHLYERKENQLLYLAGVSPESTGPLADQISGQFAVELPLTAGERRVFVVQFARPLSPQSLPFHISARSSWDLKQKNDFMARALLTGIGLVILALNCSLFVRLREKSYFYYCLYVFFYLLSFGMAYRVLHSLVPYLWLRAYHIQLESIVIQLCHISILLLSISFLRMKEQDKNFSRILAFFAWVGAANLLMIWSFPVESRTFIDLSQLLLGVIILCVGLRSWRRGFRPAIYFTIGWGAVIAGSTLTLLGGLGYIQTSFITTWAVAYAVAFEMFTLTLGLSDRMHVLEQEAQQREAEKHQQEAEFREKIVALNENLTERVREQTQDIQSMMQHIKMGLFTIDTNLKIQKDYTSYLEDILEHDRLADCHLFQVLFRDARLGSDEKSKITNALEYSLKEHEMFFEANRDCLPRSLELVFGDARQKYLEVDWFPVINEIGFVSRVLVAIRDVTETYHLRQEAEDGKREIRCLSEVLKLGSDRFERFSVKFLEYWETLEDILDYAHSTQELHDMDIQRMFQCLHTLKGSCRLARLSEITNKVHEAEELLVHKSQIKGKQLETLEAKLKDLRDTFDYYQVLFLPLKGEKQSSDHVSLVPASFPTLFRLLEEARSMLQDLGHIAEKGDCRLQIEIKEDMKLPEPLYEALSHALIHLLSNALDHGIEAPSERLAKGLPAEGTVRIFWDSAGRLCLADDGLGLYLPKLYQRATRIGWKSLNDAQVIDVIFEPGVSTREHTTLSSGRGVGLSAVKSLLRGVGAEIEVIPLEKRGDYLTFYLAIELGTVLALSA